MRRSRPPMPSMSTPRTAWHEGRAPGRSQAGPHPLGGSADVPVGRGAGMKRFAQLFNELDSSTATSAKVDALQRYFAQASDADAAWAVYFLSGGKPRQVVPMALLGALAMERAGIPAWLFDECYQAVGDLAETIAHVMPPAKQLSDIGLAEWVEQRLLPLREMTIDEQAQRI